MQYALWAIDYAPTGQAIEAWVKSCDVDARDGVGYVDFTRDAAEAKRFDSRAEAFLYRERQSTVKPLRADGEPNRPLTAFTMEIRRLGTD